MAVALSAAATSFHPMKAISEIRIPASEISRSADGAARSTEDFLWRVELSTFAGLIALLNVPLIFGSFARLFAFLPDAVRAGEWWRLFTYPFVHVSWYHLLLDSAAFFVAYLELRRWRLVERIVLVAAGCAGGLLAAWLGSPLVAAHGLCGLSGVAHGLTAVVGLELLVRNRDKVLRAAGFGTFAAVVLKSFVEALTGQIAFASWHIGSLGTPIAICHAGGVIGALTAWLVFTRLTAGIRRRERTRTRRTWRENWLPRLVLLQVLRCQRPAHS